MGTDVSSTGENSSLVIAGTQDHDFPSQGHRRNRKSKILQPPLAQPGTSSQTYGYDGADRLASLGHNMAGVQNYQSSSFSYNPASQIASRTTSNDAFASTTAYNVTRPYSVNGLNQYTAAGSASFTYDANGNLTSDGSTSFVYESENRLVSASGAKNATLSYDPLGRLWQVAAPSGTTRSEYDGDRLIDEFDAAGNRVRFHAWGPAPTSRSSGTSAPSSDAALAPRRRPPNRPRPAFRVRAVPGPRARRRSGRGGRRP
jgi:YD repeat-containing protein